MTWDGESKPPEGFVEELQKSPIAQEMLESRALLEEGSLYETATMR